jgi:mRNA interferase MazF
MTPPRPTAAWVPDRGEVIWIDHTPQAGREMKNHHPFLVLSTAPFHASVGLVVGCAMTSAAYNRGSSLAVDLGPIPERPEAHSFAGPFSHPPLKRPPPPAPDCEACQSPRS